MIQPRDFSHLSHFPGEHGNRFDILLHRLDHIQKIPALVVASILIMLALLCAGFNFALAAAVFGFFMLDWILLASLPHAKRSYGPEKAIVLLLAFLRAPFVLLPVPLALVFQCLGTLLVIYAFWIEPFRLTITHQDLTAEKLSGNVQLRLLHLSDLHIERLTRRESKILEIIDSTLPDLILFSGDVLNLSNLHDSQAKKEAREFLSRLHAPLGVYLVSGSPAVDLPELLPDLLQGLPLHWLQNEIISLPLGKQNFRIIGLSCSHRPHQDISTLQMLLPQPIPDDIFTILLYHSPDLAPNAARVGVDLQLSGHTHGGQFRLPWIGAVFTGSLYGRIFQQARYQLHKMTLYISRGIGMEGAAAPRMRFLCPPEIVFWNIHSPTPSQKGD